MLDIIAVLAILASSAGAAPDSLTPLRPLLGTWSGRINCQSGSFGTGLSFYESNGAIFANYNAASAGENPQKASGNVAFSPRPQPGEFNAESQGISVIVTLVERGQVLMLTPASAATGLGALVKVSGTARLDKKRTKATLRYTIDSPLGSDPCSGALTKAVPKARG